MNDNTDEDDDNDDDGGGDAAGCGPIFIMKEFL